MRISTFICALAWCAVLLASTGCSNGNIQPLGVVPHDASGTPTPVPPYVSPTSHLIASLPTPVPIETDEGAAAIVKWTSVEDPKSEFDKTNGTFKVKNNGLYTITAAVTVAAPTKSGWTAGEYCKIVLLSLKRGSLAINTATAPTGNAPCSLNVTATVSLPAGDGVFVMVVAVTGGGPTNSSGAAGTNGYDPFNLFTVVKVSD